MLFQSGRPPFRPMQPRRGHKNISTRGAITPSMTEVSSQRHEPAPRQGPASGGSLLAWSVPSHRPPRSTRQPETTASRSPPLRAFQTNGTRRSPRQRDRPHAGNHSLGKFKPPAPVQHTATPHPGAIGPVTFHQAWSANVPLSAQQREAERTPPIQCCSAE